MSMTTDAYQNPLRGITGLKPERIDQGVDYGGSGPIYPVGDAIIENVVGKGWPGGTFIEYVLTSGPQAGQHIYAAEDIIPSVSVGQAVTPNTPLGTVYAGGSGIETGWANPDASLQQAAGRSQFTGSNATAFGANFSSFLQALGAPGGTGGQNPTGTVPANLTNAGATTTSFTGDVKGAVGDFLGGGVLGGILGSLGVVDIKTAILIGAQGLAGMAFITLGVIIILVDTKALAGAPIPIPV